MRLLLLLLLPALMYARQDTIPPLDELDTVRIGGVLPAVVHLTESGVSMSYRTYEDLNKFIAVQEKEFVYYRQQWEYCRESQGWADLEIEERAKIADYYKDRSIMYKEGYMQLQEDFHNLHLLVQEKDKIILGENNKQLWRGAAVGVTAGVVVGLITGFIITR
jgi:hypothetical protein